MKNEKVEREAEREKRKYLEYNKRRDEEDTIQARDDSVSKGLLDKLRTGGDQNPIVDVLTNQQSSMVTIRKNVKGLHESVREMTEEMKLLREDVRTHLSQMPALMEKVIFLKELLFLNVN